MLTEPPADFGEFLRTRFPDTKTICSAVPEYSGNNSPKDFARWSDASGIDVTIVRSPIGVADTGSFLVSEEGCALRVQSERFHEYPLETQWNCFLAPPNNFDLDSLIKNGKKVSEAV